MKRNRHKEHGFLETAEVLHLYNEFRISRESFVKYRKDKQTNGICMTASDDLCAKEKISELGESKEDGEKHDLKISIIIINIITYINIYIYIYIHTHMYCY